MLIQLHDFGIILIMVPTVFISMLMTIAVVPASVVEFSGDIPPAQAGWTPILNGTPGIEISAGLLTQTFDAPSDQAVYRRSISDFGGASTFFAEWRMQTDAPSSLLDTFQVPAAFVLSGNGVSYHFRFSDEVALFTRHGNTVASFAIAPAILHTYRIELLEDDTYRFLIDGMVVESGIQPGPYPTSASTIVWGGEFDQPGHTDHWDYIRYGNIPEPATGLLLLAGASAIIARRKRRRA